MVVLRCDLLVLLGPVGLALLLVSHALCTPRGGDTGVSECTAGVPEITDWVAEGGKHRKGSRCIAGVALSAHQEWRIVQQG